MGAAGAIMTVAVAAGQAQSQLAEGKASQNYYNYLASTSMTNAKLAIAGGESDVNTIGAEENSQVKGLHTQERDVIGAQKSALASGGAGVGSKTAEAIVSDTENKVNLDEQALRYNADVKIKNARLSAATSAFNSTSQAAGYKLAGSNARRTSVIQAENSLLTGAGQVAKFNY